MYSQIVWYNGTSVNWHSIVDEKCGKTEEILEILAEIGKTQPGKGVLYELRSYYLSMSEENIKKYVELMGGICMLYSLILDTDKSEYWYEQHSGIGDFTENALQVLRYQAQKKS